MRTRCYFSIWLSLPLAAVGCAPSGSPPPMPSMDQIGAVALRVTHFPANAGRKDGCEARFTERPDFADVLEWLGTVNWSQAGLDLTAVRIPEPDGRVTITAKNGDVHEFPFYWDGRVLDQRGNRLLSGADVTKLGQLAQRGCK